MNQPQKKHHWLDKLGIAMTITCWLHCFFLPILILLAPSLSGYLLKDATFHVVLLVFILPTALVAFTFGWLRHRNRKVLWIGGLGLLLITGASLQAALAGHGLLDEMLEKILTSIGGLLLATGHFLNLRKR